MAVPFVKLSPLVRAIQAVNDNLRQQAQALFKKWFVDNPDAILWKEGTFSNLIEQTISGDWGKDSPSGNNTENSSTSETTTTNTITVKEDVTGATIVVDGVNVDTSDTSTQTEAAQDTGNTEDKKTIIKVGEGADVDLTVRDSNLTTGGNFVRNARPLEKNSGLSMYFQNLNRNKRGVAINLKTEDGKKLFSELVKSADVLLENNRPGVMGRLGFSYEECKKLNPRLVYASISGFGQYGPNANRPGYDLIGQAMGGSMSITGWPGSEPTRAGMAIGDLFGGLNAGFAICASLYNREKTGVGNHIDVALVDSIFSGMEAKMMQYVYTGVSPVKTGNKYITSAPYDSFKAKDDYFVIASGTDKHFEKLSAAMGMPELAQDPLYCDTESRKKNADSLKEIIEKWTADKTVSEVCKIIDEAGIPVAPIYNCEQAANDKNIVEVREMLVKVPAPVKHPDAPKELTVIGNPLKMEEAPCVYYKAAPDLGENNEEIFESLGFTKEQLEAFRAEGVIN